MDHDSGKRLNDAIVLAEEVDNSGFSWMVFGGFVTHRQLTDWLKELKVLRYKVQRSKELYQSAMSVTRKLQEEREAGLRRVEAALLGIKGVS